MKEILLSTEQIVSRLHGMGTPVLFEGDLVTVRGFCSLNNLKDNCITWIKNPATFDGRIPDGVGSLLIVTRERVRLPGCACGFIITPDPKKIFFSILKAFFSDTSEQVASIGEGTYISPMVKIEEGVVIGHNCTLDGNITIGAGTRIYNNVVMVHDVVIGENCEIQSGVNIGHDGFGFYENENGEKTMIDHYGGTVIGNNVYIGGNTYIERGLLDSTIISNGVKIDGSCVIGHNSVIEENCAIVAGSILLGSVHMGEQSYIASGLVKNQKEIGKKAIVGMGSVVLEDVPQGATVVGIPATEIKKKKS